MWKSLTHVCPRCLSLITPKWNQTRNTLFRHRYLVTLYGNGKRRYSEDISSSKKRVDLASFPVENIRNFSIIAHVDHGKSTLADRLMEFTGTISKDSKNEQVLDKLQVERERGITVKAQTASLVYQLDGTDYLLNLIDTPGHVDFNYEVARSLSACQGVILLVDANQGVQAQTVANFYLAFESELAIIPVMNKIDLKVAKPEEVAEQMHNVFDISPSEIIKVSAKLGIGIEELLRAIIERVPPPNSSIENPLKTLLFDSWFTKFKGAGCNVAILDGVIRRGDKIKSAYSGKEYEVRELGIMYPEEFKTEVLYSGQVGYMYANMKTTEEAQVGDTLYHTDHPVEAMPGFKPAKPMVFAGIYPMDQSEHQPLSQAIKKLTLNDSSVQVNLETSTALGQGWRLGFLGLLHLDVFTQRLEQEHNTPVIITTPNVPFKVKIFGPKQIKKYGGEEVIILNPSQLPEPSVVAEYLEPMVLATIISPDDYISQITSLIMERRGEHKDQVYIDNKRLMFKVIFPLNEIVVDFFDQLKSITSGYASFDYEDYGYITSDLTKIDVCLNDRLVEEMTQIVHISKARSTAKRMAAKLKETIPQQLYEVAIQAKMGSRVLARENIKALRKDVLAKCYGGDMSRKMKLLRRQAEGKKKMRLIGNINVPKETFIKMLMK